jgi:hypothetical protein
VLVLLASNADSAAGKAPRAGQAAPAPDVARHAGKERTRPKPPPGFTPEREAAAIEFVRRHHAELAALLTQLKETDLAEYQRAVTALFRASERLAHVQERNPAAYQRELGAWKLSSRIQLLVARIRMTPEDEKLRHELEQALSARLELRCARLVEERRKLLGRLEKLEDQLREMHTQRDALVAKQLEVLLRNRKKHSTRGKSVPRHTNPPSKPAP